MKTILYFYKYQKSFLPSIHTTFFSSKHPQNSVRYQSKHAYYEKRDPETIEVA